MSFFYEIRSTTDTVLKRDGGFASQDAAKMAAREDAKRMKNASRQTGPNVGRILVGQNQGRVNAVLPPIFVAELDLSPFLRHPVKRQYPANGGMEHGIVSTKIHA